LGYLARKRIGVKRLYDIMSRAAKLVNIVTSPTARDSIYYGGLFPEGKVFTIYNIYDELANCGESCVTSLKSVNTLCVSS
jgi:hypothetical protein